MAWETAGLLLLIVTSAPIVRRTVRDALRGHFATDIVASLAIITAIILRQPIAGLVIVLMQTGGEMDRAPRGADQAHGNPRRRSERRGDNR